MAYYIDTHTHLYLNQFEHDIDLVVQNALDKGVRYMLMPNIDLDTIKPMAALWQKFPDICLPMLAIHPTSVTPAIDEHLEKLESLLHHQSIIAIGETGIDLYWDKTHLAEQLRSFERHIRWAAEFKLPLVIHSRKSLNEIMSVLQKYRGIGLTGVMHCFPGNADQAKWFTDFGFMLGIGGVVTYQNSGMAKVVEQIDLNHLILETDAPYLTPVPFRGQRNKPEYITLVAEKVAQIKNTTTQHVANQTTQNALNLFNITP